MNKFAPEQRSINHGWPIVISGRKSWEEKAGDMKDPCLFTAIMAQESLISGWDNVHRIAQNKDPRVTDVAHRERCQLEAQKLCKSAIPRILGAIDSIQNHKRELAQKITERLGIMPRGDSQELRTVIRSMKPSERSTLIQNAVENRDEPLLSALFSAHPATTGMSAQELNGYRQLATQKMAGDLQGFSDLLGEVTDTLLRATIESEALAESCGLTEDEAVQIRLAEAAEALAAEHRSRMI